MPQLDFGRAFDTDPNTAVLAPIAAGAVFIHAPSDAAAAGAPKFFSRFGRSDWSNIMFAGVTVAGGIFCAFYFFNGAELMRSVASWPSELLYPRPPASAFATIDNRITPPIENTAAALAIQSEQGPFRQSTASLLGNAPVRPTFPAILPFNNGVVSSLPSPIGGAGPVQDLSGIIPNGDALTRTLTEQPSSATGTVAQATNTAASTGAKTIAHASEQTIALVKTTHRPRPQLALRKNLDRPNAKTPNTINHGARSTIAQTSAGNIRGINAGSVGGINGAGGLGGMGGVSGINGGGAGGGIGGINGGGASGGGGAIGGLTGAVHGGLLGGRH